MVHQVSIVVPVYNEEKAILKTIQNIESIVKNGQYQYEIIVVNDGSIDKTDEILRGQKNIILVRHAYNRGYGASLLSGIQKAKYDYVLIVDADGTYPIEDIPRFLNEMEDQDMIVGVREGKLALGAFPRRAARWCLVKLANYLTGYQIPDLNSGMRLMKKSIVLEFAHLLPQNFSFTTTITLAMICSNHYVTYIPIRYRKRLGGRSHIKPIQDAFNFLQLIVRTIMYFRPLKIFIPFGIFLCVATGISLMFDILRHNLTDKTVILTLVVFIVMAIGSLADLIVRRTK